MCERGRESEERERERERRESEESGEKGWVGWQTGRSVDGLSGGWLAGWLDHQWMLGGWPSDGRLGVGGRVDEWTGVRPVTASRRPSSPDS